MYIISKEGFSREYSCELSGYYVLYPPVNLPHSEKKSNKKNNLGFFESIIFTFVSPWFIVSVFIFLVHFPIFAWVTIYSKQYETAISVEKDRRCENPLFLYLIQDKQIKFVLFL